MRLAPIHAHRLAAVVAAATLITTACDTDGVDGLADGDELASLTFSSTISVSELDSIIGEGPVRVEIELRSGELVAREVEIETADELTEEEEIESRITAISTSNGEGTVELALAGGFLVAFNSSTEFEGKDGEDLTLDEFVTFVQDELAAGREPAVEAERPAVNPPQDPNDPTFIATELELDDDEDDGEDEIEMNIDSDNLEVLTTPPPDAQITVLGIVIDIDATNGVTEIEVEDDDVRDERKFEDLVESVDVSGSTFTLESGAVILVVPGTEIKDGSDRLESLQEVADALDAGLSVEAKGEAIVSEMAPNTLVAVKVRFEVDDDDDDDDDGR